MQLKKLPIARLPYDPISSNRAGVSSHLFPLHHSAYDFHRDALEHQSRAQDWPRTRRTVFQYAPQDFEAVAQLSV